MQIQLKTPKVFIADSAVDFRKSINGLSEIVVNKFNCKLENFIYVFYNRNKTRLKLLAYHHNGAMLIYKVLDKKHFIFRENESGLYEITAQQLSWLLAGLDWVTMSSCDELTYNDFY